jgi:hypothetical protein
MAIDKKQIHPTFVEVGARGHLDAAQRRVARPRPVPPPPALNYYNALAVERYSPVFVDVSLEPLAASGEQSQRKAGNVKMGNDLGKSGWLPRRYPRGLVRGATLAMLAGGLFLRGENPIPTALAAPSLEPPSPPVKRIGGGGPPWERPGMTRRDRPTFVELDRNGRSVQSPAATTALTQTFVERSGDANPLGMVGIPYYDTLLTAPTFVDIDGDGDFDAFVGHWGYSAHGPTSYDSVRFFKNRSVEIYGNPNTPDFTEYAGLGNNPLGMIGTYTSWQHTLDTTPTFVDIDGDGDFDAFVGHYGYSAYGPSPYDSVRFFKNRSVELYGNPNTPYFTEYAGLGNPLGMVGTYAYWHYTLDTAPTFVDIDGDGDFDAFVGHGNWSYYIPTIYDGVRFFYNSGTPYAPAFTEYAGYGNNPLFGPYYGSSYPYGMAWTYLTRPTFVDLDGDGDLDAFVGHTCWWDWYDTIRSFENIGTDQYPNFVERSGPGDNPLYIPYNYYLWDTAPTFVDLDGDGDFDAFLGHWYGYGYYDHVRFFENTIIPVGGITEPANALALLGPWLASAAAGVTGAIGAGAALIKRKRRTA